MFKEAVKKTSLISKIFQRLFSFFLLRALSVYQSYISVMLPLSCRFQPSCSEYAKEAVIKYGGLKGAGKAVQRLLRCHPFSGKAGHDPLV